MSDIIYSNHLMFIDITDIHKQKRTKVFKIISKHDDSLLGIICWINTWRQYVYQPCDDINMSIECLNDIIIFINNLMSDRK